MIVEASRAHPGCESSLEGMGIGVWREPHPTKPEEVHDHILVYFPAAVRFAHTLPGIFRQRRIVVDIRVPRTTQGCHPLHNALRYLNVPTESKMLIDLAPCLARLEIPKFLTEEQSRSIAAMERRPATRDNVFDFVFANPAACTLGKFEALCHEALNNCTLSRLQKIPYSRLKKWISKEGTAAKAEFREIVARRNRILKQEVAGKPFRFFQERAMATTCACPNKDGLLKQLTATVTWHDKNESSANQGSRAHLGNYFNNLLHNGFLDRCTTLLLIGAPGTGKTTVTNAIFNCYGEDAQWAVFTPTWDDTFPWSDMDGEMVRMVNLNDMRVENLHRGTLLNVLERKPGAKLAVKGSTCVELPSDEARVPYAVRS